MKEPGDKGTAETAEMRKPDSDRPQAQQRRGIAAGRRSGVACGKNAEEVRKPSINLSDSPLPAPAPALTASHRPPAADDRSPAPSAAVLPPFLELSPVNPGNSGANESPAAPASAGPGLVARESDDSEGSEVGARVLTHPAFNRPPVENLRRPGRKAGAISLASARRQRQRADDAFKPADSWTVRPGPSRDVLAEAAARAPSSADARTVHAALALLAAGLRHPGAAMTDSGAVCSFLTLRLAHRQREAFGVIFLDSQHALIEFDVMFEGTLSQAVVYPREIARKALALNAGAVILAHNHPSGIPEPSPADLHLTKSLKQALALVDIRVLDHVVVGGTNAVSFVERGLLP